MPLDSHGEYATSRILNLAVPSQPAACATAIHVNNLLAAAWGLVVLSPLPFSTDTNYFFPPVGYENNKINLTLI